MFAISVLPGTAECWVHFSATVCKTVRPMLSDCCLSCPICLSVCNVGVWWPNGWMDQDATWYGNRPRPRRHCARWAPSCPLKGHSYPPSFRPMSIVAKRSSISATAEHLFIEIWLSRLYLCFIVCMLQFRRRQLVQMVSPVSMDHVFCANCIVSRK